MADGADPAYDIFVSYAHVDDEPLPGVEQGWVGTFVAAVKTYLARELGRRESVRLWMDYELRGNQPLTPAIHTQLASVKVLLLFLSKGYLASRWCQEELETFHARHGSGQGRIFPVYVSPVDEIPEPLQDLLQ